MKTKLIKTKLNGLVFWYRENDRFIGQRVALRKYEEYETKLILRQAQDCDVVVDVGANIGYYTLLMAQKARRVYAIEPEENNFEVLEKNVKENNLRNIVTVRAAASNKNGRIKLYKSEDNWGDHRVYGAKNNKIWSYVNCLRLDKILETEQKISLVKIDTQGWEPAVIEGVKKIIERDSPTLFLEYWPGGYKEAGLDGEQMMRYLKNIYKKNIWQIDYWFYISKRLGKEIEVDSKTGYADLWMKRKTNLADVWARYKDVRIKKVIKSIIGYVED